MRCIAVILVFGFLSACDGGGTDVGSAITVGSTDSAIAGKTLSCKAGGPASNLTFGSDGKISGRLLGRDVTGRWYVNANRDVHTHVVAGSVSYRDDLRQMGNRWVGRTTTCIG